MNKKELIMHLKNKGFSKSIIEAFAHIRREDFIPEQYKSYAYEDDALTIGYGATISQPSTIAFMLDLLDLNKENKVLEIGSGSGYVLALVEQITKGETYGLEIIKELIESSSNLLKENKNITIINKSGYNGLIEQAPFDRILISASADKTPVHLLSQINKKGIIVASVQNSIIKLKKTKNKITKEEFPGFAFVPLME